MHRNVIPEGSDPIGVWRFDDCSAAQANPRDSSSFLSPNPVTRAPRTFTDLRRRNTDLAAIVCADPAARAAAHTTLRKASVGVH